MLLFALVIIWPSISKKLGQPRIVSRRRLCIGRRSDNDCGPNRYSLTHGLQRHQRSSGIAPHEDSIHVDVVKCFGQREKVNYIVSISSADFVPASCTSNATIL